ncbi:Uncharacterized protein LACOL_1693 [Paucilactobacillus oligofermentans DSM 15707 = LMG 22743]|nr:Uncharacterized protein LACOL_1693 [Paucilactobacillus oligofermentans DSM 15707 = LMG 22743]
MHFTLPIGIGQYHALHMLLKENPGLTICVLLLLIALAFYFKYRK